MLEQIVACSSRIYKQAYQRNGNHFTSEFKICQNIPGIENTSDKDVTECMKEDAKWHLSEKETAAYTENKVSLEKKKSDFYPVNDVYLTRTLNITIICYYNYNMLCSWLL